jgi:hypothetical protein
MRRDDGASIYIIKVYTACTNESEFYRFPVQVSSTLSFWPDMNRADSFLWAGNVRVEI